MTMTLTEAQALQYSIATTHPNLGVSIKKVGSEDSDEWVCFIETHIYYLWNEDDWTEYRMIRGMKLWKYTEEGSRTAAEKQKQAMQNVRSPIT